MSETNPELEKQLQHLVLTSLLLLGVVWVSRYFGYRRALGIDHVDPSYRDKPFVRRGIFRFIRNGMYTFGLAALWIPGLLLGSKSGLLSAAFSHLYIWVHQLVH